MHAIVEIGFKRTFAFKKMIFEKRKSLVLVFLASVVASGCTAQSQFNVDYTPPKGTRIDNEVRVNMTFDQAWKTLVGEISQSFYLINNIDKESNLINLSFSMSQNISDYIDCGVSQKIFSLGKLSENVTYKTADSSENYVNAVAHRVQGHTTYFRHYRSPKLDGRANVYVASENNGTVVRVNTRYIWTPKSTLQEYMYIPLSLHSSHQTIGERKPNPNPVEPIAFSTDGEGGDASDVLCVSTGLFEKQILDMVR